MKAPHALVVLGVLALVTGLVGLYGVAYLDDVSLQEQLGLEPGAPDDAVFGVDDAITRVLTSLGMMERRPITGPAAIPDEVGRILTAFDVPLVLDQPTAVVP